MDLAVQGVPRIFAWDDYSAVNNPGRFEMNPKNPELNRVDVLDMALLSHLLIQLVPRHMEKKRKQCLDLERKMRDCEVADARSANKQTKR
jgi:hypothetical protein